MRPFPRTRPPRWPLPVLLAAGLLAAAEPRWKDATFIHRSQDEPLRSLLADFAESQGLGASISPRIGEKVNGYFEDKDPRRFLTKLCSTYGLVWYFDGSTLYFNRLGEMRTRNISLQFLPWHKLFAALKENGVWDSRFPPKPTRNGGTVAVSGPPRYVEQVAETAAQMENRAMESAPPASGDNQMVKVFPLQHAWAGDITVSVANRETVLPGVATLLGNLAGRESQGSRASGGLSVEQVPGLAPRDAGPLAQGNGAGGRNNIQADPRTNSVIIKDTRENIQRYQSLVSVLDAPTGLVELNVSILDVSSASTRDLGVEWQHRETGSFRGRAVTTVQGQTFSEVTAGGAQLPASLDGFSIAALALGPRDAFLARVRALEQEGKAKLAARPAVLTFDNLQALIGRTQTFYVRVAGERDANLFRIQSGTVLKVTPHIVDEEEGVSVKLAIQIEDGALSASDKVDNIPVVTESVIHTQAVVKEEESLLLGGFIRTEESTVFSKVPLLGSIPVLKYLFSKSTRVVNKMERIFMITPKIIHSGADAGFAYQGDDPERKSLSETFEGKGRPPAGPGGK